MDDRKEFCFECRQYAEYELQKKQIVKTIKEKEYSFYITVAICTECGEEMSIPGLLDRNIAEMDAQYREAEGLIKIEDIEKMSKIYNLGKTPLSKALGFGEVTITRYLNGQFPSKEYSDIMLKAITSPEYMSSLIEENKNELTDVAYEKAKGAIDSIKELFSLSSKLLQVIARIFDKCEEITPLALQKLLYYIQGINLALYESPMFEETCQAWAHGPVYPKVYNLFRDFRYNPIDDERFIIIGRMQNNLSEEEENVIELVANTFGMYSGKRLESITHKEEPWKKARAGYSYNESSNVIISNDEIRKYFENVDKKFDISTENGINKYICSMIEI